MLEAKDWLSLKIQDKPKSKNDFQKASLIVSIPKKIVYLATQRNRIKRLIREAFRQEAGLDSGKVYFFRAMQNPGDPRLKEVQKVIDRLIGQTSE